MHGRALDRESVRGELMAILGELREDWDYDGDINEQTRLFTDLEFESIDAVALGTRLEEHFNQSLPFAELLTQFSERKADDIRIGELLDFLMLHLDGVGGQA
ncbi:MAG: hypothetical protein J5J06_11120 [Phycisphaerae bacterium]|nr:hypothetical protein [Phycisphaerae bacterium]